MQPFIEQPQFLLEPKSSYLLDTKPVQLECQAIRTRQIFFNCDNKWLPEQEHRKSTTLNDKGNVIIITSVELRGEQADSNGYKCFCQAWSATGGTLKSRQATIEIAYLEKIFEWEPLRTDSVRGKSAELRCRPPMGNPYPKVTWFKDNQPVEINRNGRLILSNENSLLIAQVEKIDAGNYTCVASNLAGTYSSEPAELVVHEDRGWSDWQAFSDCKGIPCSTGRQRRIRTCLNPPTITNRPSCDGDHMQERECAVPCIKDSHPLPTEADFTEWSSWSDCSGIACQFGQQQRRRSCLKTALCNGEQIQERDCAMPCTSKNPSSATKPEKSSAVVYSNWTDWSACPSVDCTSIRSRQCLQQRGCLEPLVESRVCPDNHLCLPSNQTATAAAPPSNLTLIIYSSAAIGGLLFLTLAIILFLRCCRHQQLNRRKKGLSTCITSKATCSDCHTEKNDYPFYYSIQQDTTSTRSCASQNNSLSLTHSELSTEREKLVFNNYSPFKSIHHTHFNVAYQKILQSLPAQADLRYFSVSMLNHTGCRLEIPHTGVSLTIPEDAVLLDDEYLIYIALLNMDNQMPVLSPSQTRLSPVILIGPAEVTLLKPAVLAFEHTAVLDSAWKFNLMFSDNLTHWKSILTYGQENISTPVYLQFHDEQQAFVLLESMGAYALIGESLLNQYASKYIQMACFFNHPTLRLRFFDRTSDAFERCLVEEVAMNHSLCEQPKLFMLHDNQDQLCINLDYELSSTSRIHIGYKEVPFAGFWNNRLDRSCFIFNIPDLQAPTTSVGMDQFAVHVDLYQPTILDSALHTRFYIDRLRLLQNVGYGTMPFHRRQQAKSSEKATKLPLALRQKLSQILDPPNVLGNDWRMLASHLLGINYLQYFATKASPTEHLLTLWHARQESLVNMINVLNQIGRSDAACVILTHMNINN